MSENALALADRMLDLSNQVWYLVHGGELPRCPECSQYLFDQSICQCKIAEVML